MSYFDEGEDEYICPACDDPVFGRVIRALGKRWHKHHFVCASCKEEIGASKFIEKNGKPYCEKDYHALFSPRCGYCERIITGKSVKALDKLWHPEHFRCTDCRQPFYDKRFYKIDGLPYCVNDYFKQYPLKCAGCYQPIIENYIVAINQDWHKDCFVCQFCRRSVANKKFFEFEDGKPVCQKCKPRDSIRILPRFHS